MLDRKRTHWSTRLMAAFLAFVMLLGNVPAGVFATEITGEEVQDTTVPETSAPAENEGGEPEENPWKGRSAVFVGDSITAGTGTEKIYYEYLKEALGLGSVTAMGVGGSCISAASDYGQSTKPLIGRYQNIPSADLIMVFMGTNDYGHETPLGTAEDTRDGTFYGALNTIIPALVAKHPSSQIVFVTPIHRYGFGTSKILGTKFTYDNIPNGVGATLGDYVNAVKTVCAKNGVSVIDLHTECTLDPTDSSVREQYMPDGLHPNAAGHEVIAGIMESHIRNMEPAEKTPEPETQPDEKTELVYGNKFASGFTQQNRVSSRLNLYLKAGTVITLKDPTVMQWACAKTSDENSSNNLGYFPDAQWTDKETAVVEADGWVGFTFKYRDETKVFDLSKPLSDYITIEEPHIHTYENGTCTVCGAENPNPYAGKTIACVGDSITCGIGVTKDKTDYVTLLAKSLGMDYIRLGVSGTTLCTGGHRNCNITKLTESNLAGADVVTILMGINDFDQAKTGYYTLGTIDSTDTSTIYGAVHMWCQRIVELRKTESLADTEFYFITPVITSWNDSVSSARNWDQSKKNIHGYTLRDFCNAIAEVCALYDVPVIDLNLISGLYYNSNEDNTIAEFGGDGVHPGETGHRMMAAALENALLQNNLKNDHDHSYGSWIVTTYPGCENGEEKRVCSVCTATESRPVDAVGHTYENGICTVCGADDPNAAQPMSMKYDDHLDMTGKTVEIIDAGKPTSYQVGYGIAEGTLDTAVVTLVGNTLVATGIGTAKVRIDGTLYEVTVTAAPISLLLLIGQSNMQGIDGNASESIVCEDGMVYATYADRYKKTVEDVTKFAPSALTGQYAGLNVTGDTACLEKYPVNMLTEAGNGREGMDSGIAYEWVKQTGEKVWTVNVGYGGSSINEWLEGGVHYEACLELFSACQETLRQEIAAGHFTLSHMAYFWCQGCADETQTAKWYVDKFLTMHDTLKSKMAFSNEKTFEFAGIVPIRSGHSWMGSYRAGVYKDTTNVPYYQSFKDLRFNGPRVAQYWMGNNPELADIWNVCTIQEGWATLPDGTNGVAAYFRSAYQDGIVDYTTQVKQSTGWYKPTTPAAVHDNIHYNQIGYNEIGREAARNALILMGKVDAPDAEATVEFISWDGFTPVDEVTASTVGHSATLVVPMVFPVWKSKEVIYNVTDGLRYEYYDLLADSSSVNGELTAEGAQGSILVDARALTTYCWTFDGSNLVSDTSDPYSENALTRLAGSISDGKFSGMRYQTSFGLQLLHNKAWALDIQISNWTATSGSMILSSGQDSKDGQPYVYFRPVDYFVGIGCYNGATFDNYGISLKNHGIACGEGTHTYRFLNRIAEDGSNMIYLFVDGKEIGALTDHYVNSTLSDRENPWVSGKDFTMPYFGTTTAPISGCVVDSIFVCEDDFDADIHFHSWAAWETVSASGPEGPGTEQRKCACGEIQTREVEGVWQTLKLSDHMTAVPDKYCCATNLWTAMEHDQYYFGTNSSWSIHQTGTVYSVTIPIRAGDQIFATSFGAVGENGGAKNGIITTFFNATGVEKMLMPADTYAEFVSNGGYLIAPENTVAANLVMWTNSDENELYILNREHTYENGICTVCGAEDPNAAQPMSMKYDDHLDMTGKTVEIIDAGKPTSYQVGYGVAEGTLDTAVVTLAGNTLVATGIGNAKVKIDGTLYEVTVTAAPISLIMITGHSMGAGQNGSADASVVGPDGQVYSSHGTTNLGASTVGVGISYGALNRANKVNAFTEAGTGTIGEGSGLAWAYNRLTGEKVWVLNTAVGGSNLKEWIPGTTNYTRAVTQFQRAQAILSNEIQAGHYTLSNMGLLYHNGANFSYKGVTFTQQDLQNWYDAMWSGFKQELLRDMDGDGEKETVSFLGLVPIWTKSAGVSYTQDEPAGMYMASGAEYADIFTASVIGKDWLTDANVSALFPEITYTAQNGTKPARPSKASQVFASDNVHYQQVAYNAVGIDIAENLVAYLKGTDKTPEITILGADGRTEAAEEIALNYGTPLLLTPVVEPITATDLTYTVSGCISLDYPLQITATENGTGMMTVSYGDQVLKTITFTCSDAPAQPMSMRYDDHVDMTGKTVEIADAGKPTSYQVGYGIAEGTLDTAVVTLEGETLVATGIGTAKVRIDGTLYEVTVTAAPISLLLLIGQSNMRGSEGNANQSIVCPDGMVYSTYGDDRGESNTAMTVSNATRFAPSALTGAYSSINVEGTTECLSGYPVNSLTEAGAGKIGPDSGFAYEWVKQTGEKVWVVNAAHGGTNINAWQPGTTEYEECQALFTACQETLRREIAAGHFTLSHMGYFWCQGCTNRTNTAEWYVQKYLTMHEGIKTELAFDHDSNPATASKTFEFGGIIPVRVGSTTACYRDGAYETTNPYAYHESYVDLRFSGPRVAQYWMCNNPELSDIWMVCNIGEDWVWMPDGTNGVAEYFQAHYESGTVDYTTQVAQKASWYTPTTPKAVHDSIHYNQIGYNEIGRESVRNALIMLGEIEAPEVETSVELLTWDGYTPADRITAATVGSSATLVVPKVYPVWKSKEVTYELTEGLIWDYYDLLSTDVCTGGTMIADDKAVNVVKATPYTHFIDHLVELPEKVCCGLNLWSVLEHDEYYYASGTNWEIYDSNRVYSVTIRIKAGDKIYATSFQKHGENGNTIGSANGIRVTFFDEYGVAKTLTAEETYAEFTANGGYLIAPEGAVAVNVPMWTDSDAWELYILNLPHDESSEICSICGNNSHVHTWSNWESVTVPSIYSPGEDKRTCAGCGKTETREVNCIWQTADFADHLSKLPEDVCSGLNLWNVLEHDEQYFASGIGWGGHSTRDVPSVTIALSPGDKIFATSFGPAATNGHGSSNGIRMTFFGINGVIKTMDPAGTYAEFSKNGGYLIAPEGTVAMNIPMWNNSDSNEIYILNRDHDYQGTSCTICGSEHPEKADYKGKVISILGDSISTFAGYIPTADGFNLEHLPRYPQDNLLTDVNETWWMQVINELDAKLGINDSWRGATVSGAHAVTTGSTGENAAMHNLTRIQNLGSNGTPDVILFYGGTNDLAHVSKVGTFDAATAPAQVDLTTKKWDNLADGYVHTLLRLKYYYPNAVIVAMLPTVTTSYYSNAKLDQADEVLTAICEHYGVAYVDLRDCGITTKDLPDGIHPDATGMDYITEAVLGTLLADCDITAGEHVVYKVTHNLTGVSASAGYIKGISAGEDFAEMLTADNTISITVTMGGKDITATCYADGKISIESVTGDIVITAAAKFSLGDRLQQLPDPYHGVNLWPVLKHDTDYYSATGWAEHTSGKVRSVTIPVVAGEKLYASSFEAAGANGSSTDGIRITFFSDDGVLNSMGAPDVYAEFTRNGYVTVPENAVAVNIPMWTDSENWELYIWENSYEPSFDLGDRLQQLPAEFCAGTNLWTALQPRNDYYTGSDWGNLNTNQVWSVTIPVTAGDRIAASSFRKYGTNGNTYNTVNGIRVTWFGENGVLESVLPETVYTEFSRNGYITVPEGANAVNIPMWSNSDDNELYILNRAHSYESVITDPACEDKGYTTHTCACGDSYVDGYVDVLGHKYGDWVQVTAPTCDAEGQDKRICDTCGDVQYRDTRITGDSNKILVSNPVAEDYFAGKKLLLIGDSITAGVGVTDRNTEVYGQIVGKELGMIVTNKGVSGSGYCSGGAMATNKTLTEANVRNADVITIMLGVNDWNWSVKEGSWNGKPGYYDKSHTYYQLGDFNSTDTSTFYGALHAWCQNILDLKKIAGFEDKQFVVITPLITSWNISVGQKNWNQDKLNIHEHIFREYCTAIMEVCAYYDIPVFDANMFSGIYYRSAEDNNVSETGGDGVHVNAAGHALLAQSLKEFLLEGYSYEERAVADCGHSYKTTVTEPTCTEAGFTTYYCPDCHNRYFVNETSALGHEFGEWMVTIEPTCTEKGAERRDCVNCDHFETREVVATGHDYETVVTAPTCTEKGFTTHTCTDCGDSYIDSYVNTTGHKFGEWTVTTEPTCTEKGEERRDCDNCDHFETREIATTGHDYEAVVTEATCTEKGYTTHTCHCGDSYVDSYVDAAGHKFGEWEVVNEPTCTEKGEESRDCANCDHFENREVEATGHDYEAVVTAPTCTEKGYTTHTCHCGDSYTDSYVDAVGHKFGEWMVTIEPTCTEKGMERRDCANCDRFETREVAATGHDYEAVVTAPTCTEQGYTTHTCHCGDSYVDGYVDATGHKFGNWAVVNEPTCTKKGEERRDCDNCDHFETREVEASGHDYEAVATAPTCTEKGYTTHTCHCGDSYTDSYVDAVGHKFGEWMVTIEPTCTEKGEERRDCDNCNHFEIREVDASGHDYEAVVTAPTCTERGYTIHTCSKCGDSYTDSYVDAMGHKFGGWTVITEPTCTEKGKEQRECENCDHYETREVAATGHDYEAVVTAPTCTEQGYTTHTCQNCGDKYVDTYVNALGHNFVDYVSNDDATCTVDGTETAKCERCDETDTIRDVGTAKGHKFGEWAVTTEPTCTEKGMERRECDNCNHVETREVEATGHDYEAVVTAPTCTEQGFTTHTCPKCNDSYVDSYINATGHEFGDWRVTTEATCTVKGEEQRDCKNCDHYETREVDATGHDYVVEVTAPTCTERGYTSHTCSKCEDSYVDNYVDATGHKFGDWTVTTEPTCTAKGMEQRVCENCDHFETREVAATGHDYEAVVTKPTCVDKGYTTHTCHCGDSYIDSYVDATGHKFGEWSVTTEPTCTEKGEERRGCDNCDHFETREVEASGHHYETVVTAPTCTEKGYTTHTCHCGDSYVDNYVDATGHKFGEWMVTIEPTCTEKGMERRDCANCDRFETREVAATGHDYEVVVTKPTCVDKGYTTHTCANCDDSYVDSYVNALGHEYGEWHVTKQATLESEGEERRDCDRCDDFQTRKIPKLVHNYVSAVTDPTCTEQGYTTHTCQNCGDKYVDTYVNALGHNFVDYVSNDDATCTVDGTKTAKCERCDETDTIRDVGTAKGHKFGEWAVTTEPTCTEKGMERRECDNCNHVGTREVEATGHDYEAVVTAPTCTEQGFTTHTCPKCNDSYVDSYINATGHEFGDWRVTTEPTCTVKGEEQRDCENCDHYETREVDATGHDYEVVVTKPTCEDRGYTTHTCSKCGDSYIDSYVGATGHKFGDWTTTKVPTCTEKGKERRDCDNCDHFETREIAAAGHDYDAVVTAPTCTEKGFTSYTCSKCKDIYVDSYVDAIGHKYGDWAVTTEPTCTEKGAERRDCENCDHYETREVDATGHDYEVVVTKPTCEDRGYTTHTCSKCGDSYVDSYVYALGHKYENGSCSICGEPEIKYLPGDVDLDGDVDVDDVLALLWYVLFPDDYPIEVDADFDRNGSTDVDDVLTLLWYVLFPEEYPLN